MTWPVSSPYPRLPPERPHGTHHDSCRTDRTDTAQTANGAADMKATDTKLSVTWFAAIVWGTSERASVVVAALSEDLPAACNRRLRKEGQRHEASPEITQLAANIPAINCEWGH